MSEHALLSASTAHRWMSCTPSARLEQQEGIEECSVYAQEGTCAHELAELKLSYRFGKIAVSEYLEKFEAFKVSEFGLLYYNMGFEEFVDEFVEFVVQQTEDIGQFHIYFELRVSYTNYAPQGFGTADVIIVTDEVLHVIDLKFGQGVPVTARNNPQLRLYGLGALNIFPNSRRIKMTIHQPRLFSTDTEEMSKKELLDWALNEVVPAAELAVQGKGKFVASKEACKFCKLRGKCKVRADKQFAIAAKDFEIIDSKPIEVHSLSTEQISDILAWAPIFTDWIKDVQAYALGQLMADVKIPGYKLVAGRSNRIITDEQKVKEILMSTGVAEENLMKPAEMLGISKLEAIVGKKKFAELCKDYLVKPCGKLSMAPEDDRRPEASTLATAQSDFANSIE